MALRFAVAADAPPMAAQVNAWYPLRPKMFEDIAPGWTAEIALNLINGPGKTGVWVDAGGTIRGIIAGNAHIEYEATTGLRTLAFEFNLLLIDPTVAVSPIASIIDAVKQIAQQQGALRLTGWIRDDSPAFNYLLGGVTPRCQVITSYVDDAGHTHYLIERQVLGTVG